MNILFITSGLYFDPQDLLTRSRFESLSSWASGHILCVVYNRTLQNTRIGNFHINALYAPRAARGYGTFPGLLRMLIYLLHVFVQSLSLRFKRDAAFDVIVASDPFKTGLLARLLSRITGRPFVVEVNGNYISSFRLNSTKPSLIERAKDFFIRKVTPRILTSANAVKLLYDDQVRPFGITTKKRPKYFVFHDIVPLDRFRPLQADSPYLLLVGHPWHLKGADLLIDAFHLLADEFTELQLRIVGYCPHIDDFARRAKGHPRIFLSNKGEPYNRVIEIISRCTLFVLPSRTEAMGRVLLEAMAAEKPIVAAAVDGIPRVIIDGLNGLLFKPGDARDLADKIGSILRDPELEKRLSRTAKQYVHSHLSEALYADNYRRLLDYAVGAALPG